MTPVTAPKYIAYAVTVVVGGYDGERALAVSRDGGLSWSRHGLNVPNILTVSYAAGRFFFLAMAEAGGTNIYMSDGPAGEITFRCKAPGEGNPYNIGWGSSSLSYINGAWIYVDSLSYQYYACYDLFKPSPQWQPLWGGVSSPLVLNAGPSPILSDGDTMYILLTTGVEYTTNGGDRVPIGLPDGTTGENVYLDAIVNGDLYAINGIPSTEYYVFSRDKGTWSTHSVTTGSISGISAIGGRPVAFGNPPTYLHSFFLDADPTCATPVSFSTPASIGLTGAIELGSCIFGDSNWGEGAGSTISFDNGRTYNWVEETDPYFVVTSIATNYKYTYKFWTQKVNTTE